MAGGKNFGPTSVWGSEGVFQGYNFYKGNRYYLRLFVQARHVNDGGANDVDKVFVALTNGLVAQTGPDAPGSRDYNFPSVARQDVWYKENFKTPTGTWVLFEQEFIANDNYSQLWVSLTDDNGDEINQEFGLFSIAGLYISCCPYDKTFQNTTVSSSITVVDNKIETSGTVTVPGNNQNVNFIAGKEVTLKAGFLAQNGSLFKAGTNNYCDCSPGGGNVLNLCNVFTGAIAWINNANGPGVYVPNYFNRDTGTNWYPTSYGYAKPYNAYYWKLKIIDRWGLSVYEANSTSGIDGFANQSIKWNGGNVSTGTYYVQLDLQNCTNTYTYNSWLEVAGTAHPNSFRVADKTHTSGRTTADVEKVIVVPEQTCLEDVYPNPADEMVMFKYGVSKPGSVRLIIFDETGRVKKGIVVEDEHPAGNFEFGYSIDNFTPGIYFYSLETLGYKETKKLLIVR